MAEVRYEPLVRQLNKRLLEARQVGEPEVVVGFTQSYAVYVHENLEARHNVGQAKFLEQPYRQMVDDGTLKRIIVEHLERGGKLSDALLLAGLRLQREAQLLCPVDTGALRNSAFTRLEVWTFMVLWYVGYALTFLAGLLVGFFLGRRYRPVADDRNALLLEVADLEQVKSRAKSRKGGTMWEGP